MNNIEWIDDLSEEENYVLKRAHELDKMMKQNKKIKVGILDGISE